uniref:Uncharacterized protein n=1 Tax=Rhizophora mucronata TaxID=61149 RepID=A0A2P2PV91_RHIMU
MIRFSSPECSKGQSKNSIAEIFFYSLHKATLEQISLM